MPLPPTTVRYQCSACPWTKTVALRGNAVLPGQFFMACPQCGFILVPESLAVGKMLEVEQLLEDK